MMSQMTNKDKMGGHNNNELFMDNYCKVCCAMLISEVQRTAHYESKKHANKVRIYFQMHKEEGTPTKRIKTENLTVGFQDAGSGGMDKNKFCILCNMVFTSPIAAQFHYQGKVHAKRLKQLVRMQPSVIQPQTVQCSITVSTDVENKSSERITSVHSESPEMVMQDTTKEVSVTATTALDQEDPNKFCKLCNASFKNTLMAQQHYIGKKHKKNDTRRQLMEELGKKIDSSEKNGHFSCAICSITLNSIQQYQRHLQGFKHQFKEQEVANLVKNTKSKKYHSFQDELDDFIRVQKARGLVPKMCFRKFEDNQKEEEEEEENSGFHMDNSLQSSDCSLDEKQDMPGPSPSSFQKENPLPVNKETKVQWPPFPGDHSTIQPLETSDLPVKYYTEKIPPLKLTCPEKTQDLCSVESADECKPVSSDDSTSSYKKDKRAKKKKHRREKRNKNIECKRESKHENFRKEKGVEALRLEPNTNQTGQKPVERDKEGLMLNKEGKMKQKKDKKDLNIEKDDVKQRHKKQKKKKDVDTRTEEEKLWDESILGI
ncbi:zinc finger matrin-type protein 1-like isoform X2 [Narcine bancroftii]|uniref:zinc finger matrin-type protein 1-like isoform X2 n=1 Tax=Narcine bancroftii TaxID=1343680 RepID=UPI0038316B82